MNPRDFLGSPVVKTSPSKKWVQVPSLVGELGSYMPHGLKTKTENRSNIVTNSIKMLKMAHIKKSLKIKDVTHITFCI